MVDEKKGIDQEITTVVGIDLGTTNSSVAVIRKGEPEILPSPTGEKLIPSVVLIDKDGEVVVGKDALASLIAMPSRTVSAIKRKMGSQEKVPLAGEELSPEEISSFILKELKTYVDKIYGEGEKEAVITVPAYFKDAQRRATKRAGELAGFKVERIINEPTAASLAFGLDNLDKEGQILVYDLGGGTFDVSLVEMIEGVLEVKASEGDSLLGGEDFDWRLVDHMAEIIIGREGVDPRDDRRARALLKEEAERVKKELSTSKSVHVSLPMVTVKEDRPVGLELEITRETFNDLIEDLLQKTMDSIQRVLEATSIKPQEVDEVLLVGGSTRIPKVHELVQDFFDREPRTDINPDEAVALGAAVQAGLKSGFLADSGLIATDVAPYSMGIEVLEYFTGFIPRTGGYSIIIPKNSTIPITRSNLYSTTEDNQEAVEIKVFQGEERRTSGNHPLGDFQLEGIPPNRAGAESIEVTFSYNLNGILEVTAKVLSNEEEMTVTMKDALDRSSEESLHETKKRLDSYFKEEGKRKVDEEEEEWTKLLERMMDSHRADEEAQSSLDEVEERPLLSLNELREEVDLLIERAEDLLESAKHKDRFVVKKAIKILNKTKRLDDRERISEEMDKATDMLIELESRWE